MNIFVCFLHLLQLKAIHHKVTHFLKHHFAIYAAVFSRDIYSNISCHRSTYKKLRNFKFYHYFELNANLL